jgi:2-hydroxycyclohexanecarboxyl-CoA dehydrogenase
MTVITYSHRTAVVVASERLDPVVVDALHADGWQVDTLAAGGEARFRLEKIQASMAAPATLLVVDLRDGRVVEGESVEDAWRTSLSDRLGLFFDAIQVFGPGLLATGAANVIAVVSASDLVGQTISPGDAAIAGSSVALTKALAREFGPMGVAVNCVAAGGADAAAAADTVVYLADGGHYFAGSLFSPSAGVLV